ncbi:MAG: dephospho-CoA kinase [Pirellulales bacterium]
MKTIGLVGGIGSGKSLVAEMLRGLGAAVINADQIGHAVLAEDGDVRDALTRRWGSQILAADGSVDRAAVARRVFAAGAEGEADRRFLESLVHPKIRQRLASARDSLEAGGKKVAVIDAALLFEAGWNQPTDLVVFVDAPRATRLERARKRGWADDEFAAREAAQWPVEEKSRRADVVIPNDGSQDDLQRAVQAFWNVHIAA